MAGPFGAVLILTVDEEGEVQPELFVTVNELLPGDNPDMDFVDPVPEICVPPGVTVTIHVPEGGNPFRTTLPVAREHVG